jgi:hypothetical protein
VIFDTVSGMTREIKVDMLARGSVLMSRSATAKIVLNVSTLIF